MKARWLVALVVAVAAIIGVALHCRDDPQVEVPVEPVSRARVRLAELRQQPPGSIAGGVSSGGLPVADAMVCARGSDDETTCTASTAAGTYLLAGLPPGVYRVWAASAKRGAGHHAAELTLAAGRALTAIDIELQPGAAEVRGSVRDVRGRPIAGALVHVGVRDGGRTPPAFTTRSGADGGFVAWAPAGEIYAAASADRFVDDRENGVAPTTTPIAIALLPEAAIAGTVIDARTREPLADAAVSIAGSTVRTSATGAFRVGKLRPGRYKPSATTIGGYGEAAESVFVALGGMAEGIVIEIHPVAVVAGRLVIDDAAGKPCPPDRGEVSLNRYGGHAGYFARTGDDGDILLEGVVPGTYEVTAGCRGTLSQMPYPDLVVRDSDVDDVVWRVSPGARIRGSVRARDGTPVAEASISLRAASGASWGSTVTLADGTFTADGVAPGANELDVSADGFPRPDERWKIVASLATVASIDIVLERGGGIVGEVVDASGAPVVGAPVEASGTGRGGATSEAGGRFAIDALAPGHYEVAVEGRWGRGKAVETDVVVGGRARVRVVADAPNGEITGVVVDAAGTPITDAYVVSARLREPRDDNSPPERRRGGWETPAVLVGLDGSFRITGLPVGSFSLKAYREHGSGTIVDDIPTGGHARIVMRPTGVIAGVVTSTNRSIDDVSINAIDRGREIEREERLYHTGGRFALRDLPAGRYLIRVDDDPRSQVVVTLADGERREDLRLVAQPRFTLRGRLVSRTGAPQVGWTIETPRLHREDDRPDGGHVTVSTIETAITGADGRFLVRDLPAGPVTISAANLAGDPEAKLEPIRELVLSGATEVDLGDIVVGK